MIDDAWPTSSALWQPRAKLTGYSGSWVGSKHNSWLYTQSENSNKQPTLKTQSNVPALCERDRRKDLHSQLGRREPSGKKKCSKQLQQTTNLT